MSYRGLSPVSSDRQAPEQAVRSIPDTRPGMTMLCDHCERLRDFGCILQALQFQHQIDDALRRGLRHRMRSELHELGGNVSLAGERGLATARRFDRLLHERAVPQMHLDMH